MLVYQRVPTWMVDFDKAQYGSSMGAGGFTVGGPWLKTSPVCQLVYDNGILKGKKPPIFMDFFRIYIYITETSHIYICIYIYMHIYIYIYNWYIGDSNPSSEFFFSPVVGPNMERQNIPVTTKGSGSYGAYEGAFREEELLSQWCPHFLKGPWDFP